VERAVSEEDALAAGRTGAVERRLGCAWSGEEIVWLQGRGRSRALARKKDRKNDEEQATENGSALGHI